MLGRKASRCVAVLNKTAARSSLGLKTAKRMLSSSNWKLLSSKSVNYSSVKTAKFTAGINGAVGLLCVGVGGYSLYNKIEQQGNWFSEWSNSNIIKLDSFQKNFSSTSKAQEKDSQSQSINILAEEAIERKLHSNEYSYSVDREKSEIQRFDVSQLPSNDPIEDSHVEQILTNNGNDVWFYGVFDGHGGPYTSSKLSTDVIPYVARYLAPIFNKPEYSQQDVNNSFQKAFVELDNDIVLNGFKDLFDSPSRETLLEKTLPAISGSCCLLTMYDTKKSMLTISITGDSRAILVSKDHNSDGHGKSTNNWTVQALTKDQTAEVPEEIERIRKEHPEDESRTCIFNGRILGSLQPSRAFGDYRYKIDNVDGKKFSELPPEVKMFLRRSPRYLKTPPYVTAAPVVTSHKIDPSKDKFMVIASDGLYEFLNNDEIASLVVDWYSRQTSDNKDKFGNNGTIVVKDLDSLNPGLKHDSRFKTGLPSINKDENCSTHIIRNALSCGGQKEYVDTFVSIPSPMSRKYRDDLTVTVVFFGDSKDPITTTSSPSPSSFAAGDGVTLNEKASTPVSKAKL